MKHSDVHGINTRLKNVTILIIALISLNACEITRKKECNIYFDRSHIKGEAIAMADYTQRRGLLPKVLYFEDDIDSMSTEMLAQKLREDGFSCSIPYQRIKINNSVNSSPELKCQMKWADGTISKEFTGLDTCSISFAIITIEWKSRKLRKRLHHELGGH